MDNYKQNRKEIITLSILCLLLQATLIASDILTFKVTSIGGVIFTIPALLYPLTYAIGDTLTEAYGRTITLTILSMAILIEVVCDLLISYSAFVHSVYDVQYYNSFNLALGKMYIAAIGVAIGSVLGFLTNTIVMYFLKSKFSYRSFPIRSIFSSLFGEIIFTITAFSIWFYSDPSINFNSLVKLIVSSAFLKIVFAMLYSFPAYWITKYLIKCGESSRSEALRIQEVIEISDKRGNSTFSFQIIGKRICFSVKSKQVTMNMFFALNKKDQKLIEADLNGKLISQIEPWAREKYDTKNSINSRRNKRHWFRNSNGTFAEEY